MRSASFRAAWVCAVVVSTIGCSSTGSKTPDGTAGGDSAVVKPDLPDVSGVTFVAAVANPFFPLPVGSKRTYELTTVEGTERIEIEVLAEAKTIMGVDAVVVKDVAYLNDVIIEETKDWFAQDAAGNVWYLGEDTCEFEDGVCASHHGAWEWGVDGALPGIIMRADPRVDRQPYYQEYYAGEAEDVGEVIGTGEPVEVPAGKFAGCVKTRDTSTLEKNLDETKFYCPGIGEALVKEGAGDVELVSYSGLTPQ